MIPQSPFSLGLLAIILDMLKGAIPVSLAHYVFKVNSWLLMPVLLAPGMGGVLFHEAVGHPLEVDTIHKEASVYRGRIGERLASPLVNGVDDATVPNGWGSFSFDDEGAPAQRTVLVRFVQMRLSVCSAAPAKSFAQLKAHSPWNADASIILQSNQAHGTKAIEKLASAKEYSRESQVKRAEKVLQSIERKAQLKGAEND